MFRPFGYIFFFSNYKSAYYLQSITFSMNRKNEIFIFDLRTRSRSRSRRRSKHRSRSGSHHRRFVLILVFQISHRISSSDHDLDHHVVRVQHRGKFLFSSLIIQNRSLIYSLVRNELLVMRMVNMIIIKKKTKIHN